MKKKAEVQPEDPEKEAVYLTFGFTMPASEKSDDGCRLAVEDEDGKMIGILSFSRASLGSLLAGHSYQYGHWQQYR